jgi:16S rRNA (guanine(966)-N(2))-methyltransferase RsmD
MKPRSSSFSSPPKPHTGGGEVRIIGGQWRRTKLAVANKPGLRPTPDRVRETLFNWLGQSLQGWRCLDAFAGTGALGLEAASRGAAHVLLCEQDSSLVAQLGEHVQKLKAQTVQIRRADGVACLNQQAPASLDVVFLDPPFESALFEPALKAAARAITPDGFVYLEAPQAWTPEVLSELGFSLHRHVKAGAVHAHLLQRIA